MKNPRIQYHGSLGWLLLEASHGASQGGADRGEDTRLGGDVGGVASPVGLDNIGVRDLRVEEAKMEDGFRVMLFNNMELGSSDYECCRGVVVAGRGGPRRVVLDRSCTHV